MIETSSWMWLVLAILATWRVSHLLANEDGPLDLIARFRAHLGDGVLGKLMDCFYCLSLWVAAPPALLLFQSPSGQFLGWLGMSGAACLLERVGRPLAIVEPLSEETRGETDHGMLRTEAGDVQEQDLTGAGGSRSASG